MIKVSYMPVINGEMIKEELGFSQFECEFAHRAENGSYVCVGLDEDAKEDLLEEIEWENNRDSKRYNRLCNQLTFVKEMNKQGLNDCVLVYIFW